MTEAMTDERLAELRRLYQAAHEAGHWRDPAVARWAAAALASTNKLIAEVDRLRAALAAETERCAGIAERISEPGCGCAECEAVGVAVARIRGGLPR